MINPNIEQYRQEKELWKANGKPIRSDSKVAELYDICVSCEHYVPLPIVKERGQCSVCSCLLSKDGDNMNKLRWSTTKCPIGKWVEEPGFEQKEKQEEVQPEPPPVQQFNNRKKPPQSGCGCS